MLRGRRAAAIAVVMAAAGAASGCGRPEGGKPAETAPPPGAESRGAQGEHADKRPEFWARRDAAYRSDPIGPFTAVASHYLAAGEHVALRVAADSLLADPSGAGPGVRVDFANTGFSIAPLPGAPTVVSLRDVPVTKPFDLGPAPAEDLGVRVGRFHLTFDRQDESTGRVVVYDPARLERFHGFPVFDEDPAFRVPARQVAAPGDTLVLGTTRGMTRTLVRAATLEFRLGDATCRLDAFRFPGDTEGPLFIPFRDRTTGEETYGAGRYLEATPDADGSVVLDFNEATNPWCAYSPFYNCVMPPPGNTLGVEVRAGERAPEDHHS